MAVGRRPGIALSVVVGVACAVVGCGSDDRADDRGGVAPERWAGQVCEVLMPWRDEISALTVRAQRQMDAATGPDQAKNGLVTLLKGAEDASERARSGVAAAGVPNATNGRQIAAEFVDSLRRTRDAYGQAKTTVAGLPTGNATTFYDEVSTAFGRLQVDYRASAIDPTRVSSAELKQAFDTVPACR